MKLYFREAGGHLLRTYQFILLRIALGLAFSVGVIVALLAVLWVALTFGTVPGVLALVGIFAVMILAGSILQPYVLYLVEAGHVAVLTRVITGAGTPTNQVGYGWSRVRDNFASVTVLFVIDVAIRHVLRQLNRLINEMVGGVTEMISRSGRSKEAPLVEGLVGMVQLALNITVSYVDKAILAAIFESDDENNWKPAKEGVVLYAQTWRPIFASALLLGAVFYGPLIVLAVFYEEILEVLGGQEAVIATIEVFLLGFSNLGLISLVVAVIGIVTVVHYGLVKPYLTALVLTIYVNETADAEPDPEWESRLRERSDAYRALERRADGEEGPDRRTGTWRDYFLP